VDRTVDGRPAIKCPRSSHSRSSDGSAPALTLCPFPAFGRPILKELGAPNSRAAGALFLAPGIRPPRAPHRIPTVVPSIRIEGTTVGIRWGHGGATVGL